MDDSEHCLPQNTERHLVEQILRISFRHHSVCEQAIGTLGIHHSQHRILMYLSHSKTPPSQTEMANRFGISKAAVSLSLDKLEAAGYIERTPSAQNYRQNEIRITERGRQVIGDSEAIFSGIDTMMFAGFSDEDAARLSELLARTVENLTRIDTQTIDLRRYGASLTKEDAHP